MSFRDVDLKIKPSYNSANEDIVEKFYNIALSESVKYDRISGFFNSTSLAIAASGVDKFIKNNGKMRLICGAKLNKDDLDSINNSDELKDLIHEEFLKDYNSIEDELVKNHVKVLGWMIANDYLDIKIGINRKFDSKGYDSSMLHSKIGIMYDEYGESILFNGSVNETAYGWKNNIESLKVFKSWKNSEFMEDDKKDFEDFWKGNNAALEIFAVPEATKMKLIEIAPKSKEEVLSLPLNSKPKLREYQNEALTKWIDNNFHGIFSMATGTGKTITALSCFDYLNNRKSKLLTVIVCPQKHLISQWEENLKLYNFKGKTIVASGDNPKWRTEVLGYIGDLKSGNISELVIFTTFNSFCKDKFVNALKLYGEESLLIVDEVHGIGSSEFRLGFNVEYTYKLGLSATPEIEDDFERTNFVYDEFGGIVYEYSLEKAIDNGFLTPYNYYPEFLDLNDDELDEYKFYSLKIANLFAKKKKSQKDMDKLQRYLIKRRDVINNAESKYDYLREFLSKNKGIKDLIVYCTGEQRPKVQDILNEFNVSNRKFTGEESSKKVRGKSERDKILELFAKGHYHALVAIKCLDEGVDVPSTQTALLMASTLNSRQHIQRRGRILRKSPGKKKANIYDLIIFPKIKNEPESVKSIFRNEQKRYDEYADLADNFSECSKKFVEKWEEIT